MSIQEKKYKDYLSQEYEPVDESAMPYLVDIRAIKAYADINGRPFEGENGRKHPVLIFSLEMAPEYCLHQGSP